MFLILLLIQVISTVLGIIIIARIKWNTMFFFTMVFIGQGTSLLLYTWLGAIGGIFAIIFYIIGVFIYTKKKIMSAIAPPLCFIIFILNYYIVQSIIVYFFSNRWEYVNAELLVELLVLLGGATFGIAVCFLVRFVFDRLSVFHVSKASNWYGLLLISFIAITLGIFYMNIHLSQQRGYDRYEGWESTILFLIYALMLVVIFAILNHISKKELRVEQEKLSLENERTQAQQLHEYTVHMEASYEEMRKIRHDFHNILLSLSGYLSRDDMVGLKRYYSENISVIQEEINPDNFKLGSLKHVKISEVKGLLASKIMKAQEHKIALTIEVVESIERIHMGIVDLCRCLGIILDNAIEEAIECEEAQLRVAFIKREGSTLILVANSCRLGLPTRKEMFTKGYSTKGKGRGLGLCNLEDIVESLDHVTLTTEIKNEQFIQQLEIYEKEN